MRATAAKGKKPQKLVVSGRRFVIVPEADYLRLAKAAGAKKAKQEPEVHPAVIAEAMRELREYKRTGKATEWSEFRKTLGL